MVRQSGTWAGLAKRHHLLQQMQEPQCKSSASSNPLSLYCVTPTGKAGFEAQHFALFDLVPLCCRGEKRT